MQCIERRRIGVAIGVASLTLAVGGVSLPARATGPNPDPSQVRQGAIIGGLAGAAIGAGVDHRHRGRGAWVGGLGGLIVGAIFGDQLRRHQHAHRHHPHPHPHPGHGHDHGPGGHPDDHGPWCDGDHTWEDDYEEEDVAEAPPPALFSAEVLFDPGQVTLSRGAESRLRHLAQEIRDVDGVELLLRGHSDEVEANGFDLSEKRARVVRAFLAEQGVSVRRIAWVGFGDTQPVATNETAVGRQRNRRVEIVLREPQPDPYLVGAGY